MARSSARRRLPRRALANPRSLEDYIRGAVLPRFIERLREIEDRLIEQRLLLEREYGELREECGDDAALFARRWRELAATWRFEHLNELIHQHNEYYPIERNLAIDPRTGDYVTINGRSYRREPVDERWILERFPP